MFLDRLGIAHECDYVPDNKILSECFVVRVYTRGKEGNYMIIGEEEYSNYPNKDQITWCLCHYKGTEAVVRKLYYLADLPFSGEDCES